MTTTPKRTWQIVRTISFAILVVVAIAFITIRQSRTQSLEIIEEKLAELSDEELEQLVGADPDTIFNEDTDGDGLPNWEEALWELDPNNPDTDGDGVSDNNFVIAQKLALENKNPDGTPVEEELTEADILIRNVYTTLQILKQNDDLTPENLNELSSMITDYVSDNPYPNIFTENDFTIAENTIPARNAYLVEVRTLLDNSGVNERDFKNMFLDLERIDPDLSKYEYLPSALENLIAQLAAVKVSPVALTNHVLLLNGMEKVRIATAAILNTQQEPTEALRAVVNFKSAFSEVTSSSINFINMEQAAFAN